MTKIEEEQLNQQCLEENFSANNVSTLKINDQDQPVDLSKSTNLTGEKNKATV
jgi:hypothetical protein